MVRKMPITTTAATASAMTAVRVLAGAVSGTPHPTTKPPVEREGKAASAKDTTRFDRLRIKGYKETDNMNPNGLFSLAYFTFAWSYPG
jgi:hypothetical protein